MTKRDNTLPTVQQFLGLRRTAVAMGLTRQQILRGRDKLEAALQAIQTGAQIKMLPPLSLPVWGSRIEECTVVPTGTFSFDHVMECFSLSSFDVSWRRSVGKTPRRYVFVECYVDGTEFMTEAREWGRANDLRLTNAYDLVELMHWTTHERSRTIVDEIPLLVATQQIGEPGSFRWPIWEPGADECFSVLHVSEIVRRSAQRWYLFRR